MSAGRALEGAPAEVRRELDLVGGLLRGTALATLAVLPFLAILLLVRVDYPPLASVDGDVAEALHGWARQRPDVVAVLELLAKVTSPWTFRILVLLAAAVLWQYGRRRLATWAVVTIAVGGLLGVVLKVVVGRARPVFDEPVASAPGLSFPSGHALNSMLGTAVLLLVVLPVLGRRGRIVASVAGLGAVLVTAFDRVGLGVHFLSDVVGGWALALAVVAGTAGAFGAWRREHPAVLDEVERERRATTDLHLRATLHETAALLARALVAAAGLFVLMVGLGLLVTAVLNDLAALQWLHDLTQRMAATRSAALNAASNVLSRLADTSTIIVTMLLAGVVLRVVLGRWREAAFVVLAVTLQALVFVTTQLVVSRARPDVVQLDPSVPPTSSFPSGHASAAVALYGSLAVVLLWRAHQGAAARSPASFRTAQAVAALLLLVPLAVAWSRLYRGVHFPLDIVASFLQAGLAIVASDRLVLRARLPEHLGAVLDGGQETSGSAQPPAGGARWSGAAGRSRPGRREEPAHGDDPDPGRPAAGVGPVPARASRRRSADDTS